jgi:uncharacterized membrane protein
MFDYKILGVGYIQFSKCNVQQHFFVETQNTHYEKIMSVTTRLFSCNLVLSNFFKLQSTSCNGHNFLIVTFGLNEHSSTIKHDHDKSFCKTNMF